MDRYNIWSNALRPDVREWLRTLIIWYKAKKIRFTLPTEQNEGIHVDGKQYITVVLTLSRTIDATSFVKIIALGTTYNSTERGRQITNENNNTQGDRLKLWLKKKSVLDRATLQTVHFYEIKHVTLDNY